MLLCVLSHEMALEQKKAEKTPGAKAFPGSTEKRFSSQEKLRGENGPASGYPWSLARKERKTEST